MKVHTGSQNNTRTPRERMPELDLKLKPLWFTVAAFYLLDILSFPLLSHREGLAGILGMGCVFSTCVYQPFLAGAPYSFILASLDQLTHNCQVLIGSGPSRALRTHLWISSMSVSLNSHFLHAQPVPESGRSTSILTAMSFSSLKVTVLSCVLSILVMAL